MFRYSEDIMLARTQSEQSKKLLDGLSKEAILRRSAKIGELFDRIVPTYSYLECFADMAKKCGEKIIVPCIPRDWSITFAQKDIEMAFLRLGKDKYDVVPYIEHSFPQDYNCPHGLSFVHVFMLFCTRHSSFEESQDCVLYYMDKFERLKAFS